MKIDRISFSSDFKQQYDFMSKPEQGSVNRALNPLGGVLKSMTHHELHFRKMALRFNIAGPDRVLHVFVHDNPIRAVVKKAARK